MFFIMQSSDSALNHWTTSPLNNQDHSQHKSQIVPSHPNLITTTKPIHEKQ